jgi:uncharacterized protein YjbI with pentapeptide repeats
VGVASLAAGIAILLLGPGAWWLAGSAVSRLANAPDKQLAAVDAARSRILQLLIGVGALGTLWFTAKTYALSREGHVTDRYTKAIDQLGAKTTDQQVGGIYALERIMRDSERDHGAVVEVLSAFVREHAASAGVSDLTAVRDRNSVAPTPGDQPERRHSRKPPRPQAEVQAALGVIGRRPNRPQAEIDCLRLSETVLKRAFLRGALLSCARLRYAQLQYAHLEQANLQGARLHGANLEHARLSQARLEYASLEDAKLEHAHLREARLEYASLEGAKLDYAGLVGAHLDYANLLGASLEGTKLDGASLKGAHLAGAKGDPDLTGSQREGQIHCAPSQRTCEEAKRVLPDNHPCARYEWYGPTRSEAHDPV